MNFEEYYRMREEQEKAPKGGESTSEISEYRTIKITEIVNEYHYNFISWRDYEIKKYKECIFVVMYFSTLIIFICMIMRPFLLLYDKEMNIISKIPSISANILTITLCSCLFIMYISIKEDHKKLVIKRFSYLLKDLSNNNSRENVKEYSSTYEKRIEDIKIIKKIWLDNIFINNDKFIFAKEVANWKSIYENSTDTRKFNIFSMVANRNSLVRILSLLIALFSLVAVLIAKTVEPSSVIENIESNFTVLYKKCFTLGFALLVLGYEIYYIFPEVRSSLLDYIQDFSKNKEIYVESRFNRFINFLLLNHTYKINDSSNLELSKSYDKDSI